MTIAACIVTRGNVNLTEIIESIPVGWDVVVWDNSQEDDLTVFGRYMAITRTDAEVIYVQDDDALLPTESIEILAAAHEPGKIVSNMPERFRHDFYVDSCLVGFGAIFDRDLPALAFRRFLDHYEPSGQIDSELFWRECDLVFTGLTPHLRVDLEYQDLPWASDPDRLWKQPGHVGQRTKMLELMREVRDA